MMKNIKLYTLILFTFITLQTYGMNLFVQTPNNGTISLDVEPSDSGENVKNKIFDQISIPVINQVISWNGTTIQDGQTLADVGIVTNNSTIVLTVTNTTQVPEKMSYQAVVRNTTNNLVTNQPVGMQISILQGSATGTAVYVETQTPTSNANGLVTLEIGGGLVVSGNMATINWANGPYFIKTETDPTGGSSYTITGTSQLLSAPYALYAKTSGSSTPGPAGPQGPPGIQGPAGANGLDGATGPMGPQGIQGPVGPAGANGLDGATGPMGPQGPQGLTGPQGPAGANGLDGATGPMGPQGPQGLTGPQGPAGANGLDGATGLMGPQGIQGPVGPAGANGLDGATGPMGPQGPQGLTGANGLDGATGPMGPQGPQGLTGPQGPAGANGLDGATGPAGPQGIQGIQGPVGPVGSAGTNGTNGVGVPTGGTAGQVLAKVNGTDYNTQWVTPSAGGSGASVQLFANKVGGSSETLPVATSTSPTTIVFNNVINSPTLGTYNNTTGVFTVGTTGAGTYLIQVKLLCNDATPASSTVPPYLTLIKNNATYGSNGGDVFYGDYPTLHNVLPTGVRGQGSLTKVVQLAAGDTFRIVAVSANSSTASQPTSTVAGSNITIMKM